MTTNAHGSDVPSQHSALPVLRGMERLAQLDQECESTVDALLENVLQLLGESLNVGLVFLSRVDADTLHIQRVNDRTGMGLLAGDAIPLCDTY